MRWDGYYLISNHRKFGPPGKKPSAELDWRFRAAYTLPRQQGRFSAQARRLELRAHPDVYYTCIESFVLSKGTCSTHLAVHYACLEKLSFVKK